MSIVGLDLSLTATGVATEHGSYTLRSKARGPERLVELRAGVMLACEHAVLAVIEGYSYGSKGRSVFDIGELGGVIRVALWERGIPFVTVAPSALKKYATGKGNAPKDEVFAAAIRRLGYAGNSHDEADALWLRAMGADALGMANVVSVPATHRVALDKVDWPAGVMV